MIKTKVIYPHGILNAESSPKLQQEVKSILSEKFDILVLDLEQVKFVDSAGLGGLVVLHKLLKSASKKLILCSVNEQAKSLLKMTKLDRIIHIYRSQSDITQMV